MIQSKTIVMEVEFPAKLKLHNQPRALEEAITQVLERQGRMNPKVLCNPHKCGKVAATITHDEYF